MKFTTDRRSFLKIVGVSLGYGALYRVAPALGVSAPAQAFARALAHKNGEAVKPFSFVQMSDTHVGFGGPPNPLGTLAFERAVEMVNALPEPPELILFTGDLTHDSEEPGQREERMGRFRAIASRLKVRAIHAVPGEHDAGLDGGALFHAHFGPSSYSFDHRGVHFVALDNVSRATPEVGPERIAWLQQDLARYSPTTPVIAFTHRPLFDLKPEWEWFTKDGDDVMKVLSRHESVTVLYGHIHREHVHEAAGVRHLAARSLIFAFNDPDSAEEKKPLPFDKEHPFRNLGPRVVRASIAGPRSALSVSREEIELTMREHSGTEGFQQLLRPSTVED